MTILAMHVELSPKNPEFCNVYVLVEGTINDVAAYMHPRRRSHVEARATGDVAGDALENGLKLTEREASKYFTVPDGKHYRR